MRATLHLISAGVAGTACGYVLDSLFHTGAVQPPDFELVLSIGLALTAIANLIYAFKD